MEELDRRLTDKARPDADLDRCALAALGVSEEAIADRIRMDGDRAIRLLSELPALADRWQQRLGCSGARMLLGGSLSVALACRQAGDPVVLKLSGAQTTIAEAAALAAWDGVGAARLRWASDDGRALLLDAIAPGTPVRPGEEADDVRRAGQLLSALHRVDPIPPAVPDAGEEIHWRFERAHDQLARSYAADLITHAEIDDAHERAMALHADRDRTVLCHGDCLDKNLLLDANGEWWAIDPRPCAGDPCLDAAFWALTHRHGAGVRERCELLGAAAGLRAGRLWAWASAFTVAEAALVTDRPRALAYASVSGASTSDAIS